MAGKGEPMKAIVIEAFGGIDRLVPRDQPAPVPAPGEITIDVAFAGVGFVDTLVRSGAFSFVSLPVTPGIEVSGLVRDIGPGVVGFSRGQPVAALLTDFTNGGMGGYAEIARAKAALTIPLEADDEMPVAAAIAVNGATAFMAMEGIARDANIAISGASGGLGQNLITAAVHAGAKTIVAIASNSTRANALRRLGATTIVSPDAFAAADDMFDAAFDMVGGEVRLALLKHLRNNGRLILLGNASGEDSPFLGNDIWLRSLRVEGLSTGELSPVSPERIAEAAHMAIVNARKHQSAFEVFDFYDVGLVHQMLSERRGPGKIILKMPEKLRIK